LDLHSGHSDIPIVISLVRVFFSRLSINTDSVCLFPHTGQTSCPMPTYDFSMMLVDPFVGSGEIAV